jgi:hypothetical protein
MMRPRTDRSQRRPRLTPDRRASRSRHRRPWSGFEALEDRTLLALFVGSASGPGLEQSPPGLGGAGALGAIGDGPGEQVGFSFGASMSVNVLEDESDPSGTEIPVDAYASLDFQYMGDLSDNTQEFTVSGSVDAAGNTAHFQMPDPDHPGQYLDHKSGFDYGDGSATADKRMTVSVGGGTISVSANMDATGTFGSLGAGWMLHVFDTRPNFDAEPPTVDEYNNIRFQFNSSDLYNMGGATTAGLYWAKGKEVSDIIPGPPPLEEFDVQAQFEPYVSVITPDMYRSPPEGAKYIVAVVDRPDAAHGHPRGLVVESDETDNKQAIPIPTLGIKVSATKDDAGTPDDLEFGQYLAGVKLDNTFTVTTQPSGEDQIKLPEIAKLQVTIPGGNYSVEIPAKDATDGGGGAKVWNVPPYDMGQLSEDTTLEVTAYDAQNNQIGTTYKGTIHVADTLDIKVKAKYPGGPSEPVDVETLRFLHNIPLNVTYSGTVSGLSDFYAGNGEITKAQIGSDQVGVTWTKNGPRNWTFQVEDDASNFPSNPEASFITLLAPTTSGGDGVIDGFTKTPVISEDLPAWMGPPDQVAKSFDEAVAGVFPGVEGAYVLTLNFPAPLSFDLPNVTDPTKYGLFDDLKSYAHLGFSLTVYAKPTFAPGDVRLKATNAFAQVELLNQVLLDPTALKDKLESSIVITGSLDEKTLDVQDSSLSVDLKDLDLSPYLRNKLLFDVPFGGGAAKKIVIPVPGTVLGAYAKLGLQGRLQGLASQLVGGFHLQVDVAGGSPTVNTAATTFNLRAGAKADVAFKGSAEAGLTVIPINFDLPVGSVVAEGHVGAELKGV